MMSNKHIIIIRNAAPQDFGGGERFPIFLAEELSRQQYQPIIVSRSKKLLEHAKERNVKTVSGWWWKKQQWSGINNILLPLYFLWQVILFFYYLSLFKKMRPSVVHIQSKDDFIAATYAGIVVGARVVWTDHADLKHIWKNLQTPYKNIIGKLVFHAAKKATVITVVSHSEEGLITSHLPENHPIHDKITVVYNGVFDEASSYLKSESSRPFTYLVASRLVVDKGISEAIEAFKKISLKHTNTQLIFIGDGPEAEVFHQQAQDISSIHFKGHQTDPLSFMSKVDVFVHPTYHEGFSVALVEASMMSLPIIATSVGGNPEIIHNKETGLLVPAKDAESLSSAMDALINNEKLRTSLAQNARKQYEHTFRFDRIVKDRFIPIYQGVNDV